MSEYVVMPASDWQGICDATRSKTGTTDLLKSGEVAEAIEGIQTGGGEDLLELMCSQTLTEYSNDTITKIGAPCFYGQSKLTKVSLPNCEAITGIAFRDCYVLADVNLPKLRGCENNLFRNCSSLVKVSFPGHSGRIDVSAFEGCTKLQCADFAEINANQGIASYGFGNCSSLTALIIRSETVMAKLAAVAGLTGTPIASGTGYIYVHRVFLNDSDVTKDYRRATNWATYADQFRAIEDYPDICGEVSA